MSESELPVSDLVGKLLSSSDGVLVGEITDTLLDTTTRVRVATVELDAGEGVQLIPLVELARRHAGVDVNFDIDQIRAAPVVTVRLDWRTLPEALENTRRHFGLGLVAEREDAEVEELLEVNGKSETGGPTVPERGAPTLPWEIDPPSGPGCAEDDDPPWLG